MISLPSDIASGVLLKFTKTEGAAMLFVINAIIKCR